MLAQRTGHQAAGDVEQADQRDRNPGHAGLQPAQRDFAWQVRDQEGDVETAGEEPQVQHPVTAIAHGDAQLLAQGDLANRGARGVSPLPSGAGLRRNGQARGRVSSEAAASRHIAVAQPKR